MIEIATADDIPQGGREEETFGQSRPGEGKKINLVSATDLDRGKVRRT
jgi:hypothetical protein